MIVHSTCRSADIKSQGNAWRIKVRNPNHKHGHLPAAAHPEYRRAEVIEKRDQIESLIKGTPTREIISMLQREDPNSMVRPRYISNMRRFMKAAFLRGRTPLQAIFPDTNQMICL